MKILQYLFSLIIMLAILGGGVFLFFWSQRTVCDRTLTYDIGRFDNQFNISQSELLSAARQAEEIWEREFDKNLFNHQSGSNFKINLIYDERQQLSNERISLDEKITVGKGNFESLKSQYEQLIRNYEIKLSQYEQDVNYWNSRGGAPQEEYASLTRQRQQLDYEYSKIKNLENKLNDYAGQINSTVNEFNKTAGKVFHKGDYSQYQINIYEFQSRDELVLTLAHEFGHALGIGHVDDVRAIMNPILNQEVQTLDLAEEDIAALSQLCTRKVNLSFF